jgi:sodium transport system ATP-binding protein
MSEVEKLCDVIGVIHNGSLLAEGTPAQLRQEHREKDLEEIFVRIVTAHVDPRVAAEVS